MMPWGHAAFGYALYSLGHRAWTRAPPSGKAVLAALFGTQLPDLVDKPLSWGLHLFPQGYSVAHSVFVAIPIGLLVIALGVYYDKATSVPRSLSATGRTSSGTSSSRSWNTTRRRSTACCGPW